MSNRELHEKVALITGVSRRAGIGAAVARELAGAGAKIFVAFLRKYDEGQSWGVQSHEPEMLMDELAALSEVSGLEIDLADPSGPPTLFKRATARFGRVDILVNCAGVVAVRPFAEMDASTWDHVLEVNLRGTFLCCHEAFRIMAVQGSGVIVNLSSLSGVKGIEKFR